MTQGVTRTEWVKYIFNMHILIKFSPEDKRNIINKMFYDNIVLAFILLL